MPRSRPGRQSHQLRTPIVADEQSLYDAMSNPSETPSSQGDVDINVNDEDIDPLQGPLGDGFDEDLETDHEDDSLLTTTSTTTTTSPPSSLTPLKEIGNLASWTVSTAKPNCGIPELRNPDTNLFWQSDGPQPHTINIHFAKRVLIKLIRIYLDYKADESYTPTKISVMSGTGYHDLQEVCMMVLEEPLGWVEVDLGAGGVRDDGEGEEGRGESGGGGCLRSWLVQVVILGNHQNGKDTHVRGLQVFAAASPPVEVEEVPYTSSGMLAELGWR